MDQPGGEVRTEATYADGLSLLAHIYDPGSPVASGKVVMKGALSTNTSAKLGFVRLKGLAGPDTVVLIDDERQGLDLILSILTAVEYMTTESAPDMIVPPGEFSVE